MLGKDWSWQPLPCRSCFPDAVPVQSVVLKVMKYKAVTNGIQTTETRYYLFILLIEWLCYFWSWWWNLSCGFLGLCIFAADWVLWSASWSDCSWRNAFQPVFSWCTDRHGSVIVQWSSWVRRWYALLADVAVHFLCCNYIIILSTEFIYSSVYWDYYCYYYYYFTTYYTVLISCGSFSWKLTNCSNWCISTAVCWFAVLCPNLIFLVKT